MNGPNIVGSKRDKRNASSVFTLAGWSSSLVDQWRFSGDLKRFRNFSWPNLPKNQQKSDKIQFLTTCSRSGGSSQGPRVVTSPLWSLRSWPVEKRPWMNCAPPLQVLRLWLDVNWCVGDTFFGRCHVSHVYLFVALDSFDQMGREADAAHLVWTWYSFEIIAILIFKSWMHPNLRFMTTRSEAISFPADFFRETVIHVRFWVVPTDVKRLLRELDWCWLWSRRNSLLWFSKPCMVWNKLVSRKNKQHPATRMDSFPCA